MKKNGKSCVAVLSAATLMLFGNLPAGAMEASDMLPPTPVQVLALGDDCLAATADGSAADMVADYLGGTAVNLAQVGMKASDLLQNLESDSSLQQEVAQSDVILVSVGVNDVIRPILYENTDILDASKYNTLTEVIGAITESAVMKLDARLSAEMPGVVAQANQTVTAAVDKIYRLNPTANIVVQTVPNPLALNNQVLINKFGQNSNRPFAVNQLRDKITTYLCGGDGIATGLNQTILSLPHTQTADFYDIFMGAENQESMGYELSCIETLTMEFQPLGQVLQAAAIVNSDQRLEGGDGAVLSNAYDGTGQRSEMAANRPELNQAVETAAGQEKVTYYLGDVDNNGEIQLNDAYLTLMENSRAAVMVDSTLRPAQRRAGDADNDGKMSLQDAYTWLMFSSLSAIDQKPDLQEYLIQNGRK